MYKSQNHDTIDRLEERREYDYRLVQHSLHGNERAWNELYRRAYPIVYRYAYQKAGNIHDAQDLASESLFRCYCKRDCYTQQALFSTWACGFVNYVALENARKRTRWERRWCPDLPWDYFGDPLDYVIAKERRRCLRLAYASLSEKHRTVIDWSTFHRYTQTEVRRKLDLSRSEMREQAVVASRVLRRRFLTVYEGTTDAYNLDKPYVAV